MYLSEIMREKKLTDAKLAKELGVANSTVYQWRMGRFEPRGAVLVRLCEVLGCSSDELYGIHSAGTPNLNYAQSKLLMKAMTRNGQYTAQTLHRMATNIRKARGGKATEFEAWLRDMAEALYKVELRLKQKKTELTEMEQLDLFEMQEG